MALLALLFAQQVLADGFYDQLCRFNYNWKKYAHRAPAGKARVFTAEKDLVAAHLGSVLTILRSNPVNQLSPQQYRSRLHLIQLLDSYRAAGRFPINSYSRQRTPVFIDANNTYCAVAYLLQQTGQTAVAKRIAAANNLAWVKEIHDPALPVWQKASGLSLEELKLIQGVYDYYEPRGFILPNRYEIPQQPTCTTAYFSWAKKRKTHKEANIWCLGEGANGVLHGRWIQNHAPNMPWIIGYYDNGKRSGQWQEYYQGTTQLCRTEEWKNDKLNGIRRRFDRVTGELTEEILFKDGVAITKTNYDRAAGLAWVRQPLPDSTVFTKVFDTSGRLLATGREKVSNPGNLQWFQNIELTALNSMMLKTKDIAITQAPIDYGRLPQRQGRLGRQRRQSTPSQYFQIQNGGSMINLYNTPPLVTYLKEGVWAYYRQGSNKNPLTQKEVEMSYWVANQYPLLSESLWYPLDLAGPMKMRGNYDSLLITYNDDKIQAIQGKGYADYIHLQFNYHNAKDNWVQYLSARGWDARIKSVGERNQAGHKIGVWKHYDFYSQLYKTENFILPRKDEEEEAAALTSNLQ